MAIPLATACDDSFSPTEPSNQRFSVFGFLNASADTQWVRVTPIRPLILTDPDPLTAAVTLEHMGTGRVIELRDSVFRYSGYPGVGSEGVYLHNFWTTEKIEPGVTYRFSVADREAPSEAVVTIPPYYDLEVWLGQGGEGDFLHLTGLSHVAFATITQYYDSCGPAVENSLLETRSGESGTLLLGISRRVRSRESCGSPQVEKHEVLVVGSGAPWPSGREYATSALGVPDAPSNISNSVGFLGGVLTRIAPYEFCTILRRVPVREHCVLRYDEASATLQGTVTDLVCEGGVAGATVRLLELNPEVVAAPKVRSAPTGRSGTFEIGALEPGRVYAVSARLLDEEGLDLYQEYADTLELAAGERRTYDIGLRPLNPCPA